MPNWLFLTRKYKCYLPQFFNSYLINIPGLVLKLVSKNSICKVLQSIVYDRDNRTHQKGLTIKHQTFYHYQRLVSIFLTKPKDIAVYYSLSGSHIVVLTIFYQIKPDIRANMLLSNTFENIGRKLTGQQFSCQSFLPFLCKGVTSTIFKQDGKEGDLKELLISVHKKLANMSKLSLIILMAMSQC